LSLLFSLTLTGEANKLFREFAIPPALEGNAREVDDLTSACPRPTAAPCQ
jgi:hypothetical protein